MMNSVKRWQPEIVMDGKKPRIHIREWDFGIYVAHEDYAALAERVRVLEEAANSLVKALDLCQPAIDNAFGLQAIHGWDYKGPTYGKELDALKTLLAQPAQSGDTDTQADAS